MNAISALTLALPAGSVIPITWQTQTPMLVSTEGLCVQNRMVSIYALPTSLERMRGPACARASVAGENSLAQAFGQTLV